ncbi:hypothetical protein ELH72_33235 [Rhizobium ruizarguesonis]|nr:hypothetical protein ELH72_33235 [Rhizobium ruizarguesonis]
MKSARALGFATSRHLHHVPGHDRLCRPTWVEGHHMGVGDTSLIPRIAVVHSLRKGARMNVLL